MEANEFGPEEFKDVMAKVASTVTVVTANTPDGPIGLTVSAFTSVSADPPIVLVCIDKVVGSLEPLIAADGYTVNILPQDAEDVAMLFAAKGADRFGSVEWKPAATPAAGPVLADASQTLECETILRTEMGDHWVVYGRVVAGRSSDGVPLIYLNRGFMGTGDLSS
jgi:flavin reductase ActVB